MKRIFLTLAVCSALLLLAAFVLGLSIEDAAARSEAAQSTVRWHFLAALGALCFTTLVHAVWLTYFMGTGRWMEETSRAYQLPAAFHEQNRSMKYGTMPLMFGAFLLLLLAGGLGAAVDPASTVGFDGVAGVSGPLVHFLAASIALGMNIVVHLLQYQTIDRNGRVIEKVMQEVRRIRQERGLPV